jgi:hypothetical protein
MPYTIVKPSPSESNSEMVAAIAAELRGEPTWRDVQQMSFKALVTAPNIIEEQTPRGPIHVTVIWDEWRDLAAEQRGRIILDAYREALGEEKARTISIAMGLTPAEAMRLGIS